MFSSLISVVVATVILYYVFYLENEKCHCVMDWRHNYVKYFTMVAIVLPSMVAIVLALIRMVSRGRLKELMPRPLLMLVAVVYLVAAVVNVYSVFTYVGELDSTKCGCAVHDMKNMHTFLYYWRYFMAFGAVLLTIMVALLIIGGMGAEVSGSTKEHHKTSGKSKKH